MRFFCLINGTPRNVPNMKFHVDGDECAIAGTWHDDRPWTPNKAQFRAALPARWRKAFDRECASGVSFWHEKNGRAQCHISLSDRRGKYLATIYCVPATENKES